MKKTVFALIFIFLVLSLGAQDKKVAIISVFVDKNVTGSFTEALIQKVSEDDHFNFDSLATDFKNKLFEKYIAELPVEIIPENEVIEAEGYKDLKTGSEKSVYDLQMQPAIGYVFINPNTALSGSSVKNIRKAFELFPEAELVMICYVDFSLGTGAGNSMISGNKIFAYANFKIFDKNGKKVVAIREGAQSKGMMLSTLGGSVYDGEKLQQLCYEALDALYEDLDRKLSKNYKKVKKKLDKLK